VGDLELKKKKRQKKMRRNAQSAAPKKKFSGEKRRCRKNSKKFQQYPFKHTKEMDPRRKNEKMRNGPLSNPFPTVVTCKEKGGTDQVKRWSDCLNKESGIKN